MQPQLPAPTRATSDKYKHLEDFHRILGMLRRGWRFLAIAIAISLTLATIHLARSQTVYQASAKLLVLQQGGRPVSVANAGGDVLQPMRGSNDALETHVIIMRSPVIVERAIAASGVKNLRTDAVIDRLVIKLAEGGARVLQVDYKADSRQEALRVTQAVILSYDQFLKDNYQKNTTEVITLIVKVRDELLQDLRKLEREYLEFRKQNPAYTSDEKGRPFVSRRLDQWDQAANEAMVRTLQLQSQLELGQKLAEEGAGAETVHNALSQLGGLGGDVGASTRGSGDQAYVAGNSLERLEAELGEVEFRRQTIARLLEHLRTGVSAAAASRRVDDQEIADAFNSDPTVIEMRSTLRRLRSRLSQAERVSRRSSDASVMTTKAQIENLDTELEQLWRRKRPILVAQLSRTDGDSVRDTEAELTMLTAREAALRERLKEVKGERVRQLERKRDHLAEIHGAGHPQVRQVHEQIARLQKKIDPADDPGAETRSRTLLESIERSLEAMDGMRTKIQKRFDADLEDAKKAENSLLAESNLRNNLERQRALFNSVVDQLKQAQLVSDFGSVTAKTINPPTVKALRPQVAVILIAALVIGAALGGVAAFVADLLDARIRSMSEIRRVLELHVLGVIPHLPTDQQVATGEIGLISHLMPRSPLSESYKAVRTNIEFLRRNQNAQVILVTSPQSGDGKSTTTSNLAISLAHAGRRVLLVDGDLRRPCQHTIHDLRRDRGLVQVLQDLLSLEDAVQPTRVENLDLLTAGPDVPNPAELLASHRLAEFLDDARQAYDVVVFDSSPLLAITDPSIIAAAVDRIVLVARASVTRLHDAERAVELLRTLGTPVLGAVINGLTPDMNGYGTYGYGTYGYGTYGASSSARGLESDQPAATPVGELTNGKGEHKANGTAEHKANGKVSPAGRPPARRSLPAHSEVAVEAVEDE